MYGVDCNNLAANSQGYQCSGGASTTTENSDSNLSNVSLQNLSTESVKNIFVLCQRQKIIRVIKNSFAVTLYLMSCLVFTCICFMPDNSLQVYRCAWLASSQVFWFSQSRGICGGPDINLKNKNLIAAARWGARGPGFIIRQVITQGY